MAKIRCCLPTCGQVINFQQGHSSIGDRYFCGASCANEYTRQNDLIKFAAQGAPIFGRRPTKERKWYTRDG